MLLYGKYNDEQLLDLLRGSDEKAFEEIYRRYWQQIYAVGYHFSQQKQAAEEAVQQVFMSLWDRREQLAIQSSLQAYLATAAKYTVLDQRIKEQRRQELLHKIPSHSGTHSAEEHLQARILEEYLHEQVEQLPERTKIIFKYSREAGLSTPEIAEVMSVSPKTVESHITRAIKALRVSLQHINLWLF